MLEARSPRTRGAPDAGRQRVVVGSMEFWSKCEHVEVAAATHRYALGVGGRVGRDPPLALCPLEDPVQRYEDRLDRPAGQLAVDEQALAYASTRAVSIVRSSVSAPNPWQEVAPDRVARVADRRRPAVLLVRGVCQPRVARLAERMVMRTPVPRIGRLAHGDGDQLLERCLRLSGRGGKSGPAWRRSARATPLRHRLEDSQSSALVPHGPGRTRTFVERIMSAEFAGLLTLASGFLVRPGGVVGPSIGRVGNTQGTRQAIGQ
jgi:hypothetical protein